ncbi:glycosyltransferase [Paraflavitalea pollutisoli]|uniref:glycosyltransferase n=1 Tax=Paraflavitalea pollutisoli TaxID=3034143 RepID=UPI0023EB492C|nr:glycosyltransferase [Paraflavitalea sp. H1-2-19X]
MQQSAKILIRIKAEKRWLDTLFTQYPIDLVISDNRYGLYTNAVPAVFITHQLRIKTGLGHIADNWLQKWNYRLIRRFAACWIPDEPGTTSLAGELSHPKRQPPIPVSYLGPLTRFTNCPSAPEGYLLIILSGPEPQRSLFEQLLIEQLTDYKGDVVLIRGLPQSTALPVVPANCQVLNHAPANQLQQLIGEAGLVISRCGYTSVMDLLVSQKKTVLVPTPGQSEQEYLATHLHSQGWSCTVPQQQFQLHSVLEMASRFNYRFPALDHQQFRPVVANMIASLPQRTRS